MKTIQLKAERTARPQKRNIGGVEFLVTLSPYFFPEKLECDYKEETGCLVINFRYLDDEPKEQAKVKHELVSVWIGKHTGKLLSLHVRVDKHNIDFVKMSVVDEASDAIEDARQNVLDSDMSENYKAATAALKEHRKEIAELVPA